MPASQSVFLKVSIIFIGSSERYSSALINNNSSLEVWKAQGLNRFNTEYHKSTNPPCSNFGGTNENGIQETELTKKSEFFTIKKCNSLSGNCTAVSAANNYFCFLPDGSSPENIKASIESTGNAGNKTEFIHFYDML